MEEFNDMKLADIWENVREGNAIILDTRTVKEYSNSHIPGSLCAPYSRYSWGSGVAQYLSEYKAKVVLLAQNRTIAEEAVKELKENQLSIFAVIPDDLESWVKEGLPTAQLKEISVDKLHENLEDFVVIDVREPYEWNSGVIKGAERIPIGDLASKLESLQRDRKYAVVCAHGNRSQSAAIYLSDNGFDVENIVGGMAQWLSRGFPVEYQ